MINTNKVAEGIDYELVPTEAVNVQAWDVRILTGDYVESVIRFGNIAINGEQECLNFNFDIISTPYPDLSDDSPELQDFAGSILIDIIEVAITTKALVTEDKRAD